MPPRKTILVFAKLPHPGRVKTRLLGTLMPRQAASLHEACLRDTLRMVRAVRGAQRWLLLAASPHSARRFAGQLRLSAGWHLGTQGRGDLGERLARAFRRVFRQGAHSVLAVGTDSAWIGTQRLREAFRALEHADVVLGPTDDGGYYVLGARRFLPELFRGIPWGSARVLEKTVRALQQAGASYQMLPRDFDLDRPADLRRAERLLRRKARLCPALRQWLMMHRAGGTNAEPAASGSSRRRLPHRHRKRQQPGRG